MVVVSVTRALAPWLKGAGWQFVLYAVLLWNPMSYDAGNLSRLMRQNLRWAVAYNGIAVAIALSGFIYPGYASLGMAGSSLLVTLNALRIYRTAS